MYVKRHYLWSLARVFSLFGYCLTRERKAHRHLVAIEVFFVGCNDIWGLELAADHAARRWATHAGTNAPLIHVMGGSSYGAFRGNLTEARRWLEQFVHELGIKHAMVAIHLSRNGRVDFHVLAANLTTADYPLFNVRLLTHARTIARRLTTELNERRLRRGQLPIANMREDFTVFFPDPRLELKAPAILPTSLPAQPCAEAPKEDPAGPGSVVVDTTNHLLKAAPGTIAETTTETLPPSSLLDRPSSPAPPRDTPAQAIPPHGIAHASTPSRSRRAPVKVAVLPPRPPRLSTPTAPDTLPIPKTPSEGKSHEPALRVSPPSTSSSAPPMPAAGSAPAPKKSRCHTTEAALWEERCRLLRSAWQDARDGDKEDLEKKQKARRALEQFEREWQDRAKADAALMSSEEASQQHLAQQAREFLTLLAELNPMLLVSTPRKTVGSRDLAP